MHCDECFVRTQVLFAYKEAGEHKQALVKVRLCPKHAMQLNHKQNQRLMKKRKQQLADEAEEEQAAKRHEAAVDTSVEQDPIALASKSTQPKGVADNGRHPRHGVAQQPNPDKSEELFAGLFD